MSQIIINETTITLQPSGLKKFKYQIEFSPTNNDSNDGYSLCMTLEQIETLGQVLIAFANTQR